MKAIMISIKPKWCAEIMNGNKTIEVRKNKALASAIQKLIDEYGYADFYVYCSKGKPNLWLPYEYDCFELDEASQPYLSDKPIIDIDTKTNGKVVFKFRCYKVEEITIGEDRRGSLFGSCHYGYHTKSLRPNLLMEQSCLDVKELIDYLGRKTGYAIHISDLEIFDRPKELWEFETTKQHLVGVVGQTQPILQNIRLTKAPQNFCYVEVER